MTQRIDTEILESTTVAFRLTIYDVNSSVIVPSSVQWWLYNSLDSMVASGGLTAPSSQSLITLGSSLMLTSSGENRPKLKRVLRTRTAYTDSEIGEAIHNEAFQFTLVNNPAVGIGAT